MEMRRPLLMRALPGVVFLLVGCLLPVLATAQAQPRLPSPPPVPQYGAPAAPPAPASPAVPAAPAPAPGGRRDPFDPLVKKPEPGKEPTKPQQLLAGVKLVGVIWDPKDRSQIRALVETSDGLGYYLRANEERFGGRVTAIDRDRVQFLVKEQTPGGATRERTIELKLAKPDVQ